MFVVGFFLLFVFLGGVEVFVFLDMFEVGGVLLLDKALGI